MEPQVLPYGFRPIHTLPEQERKRAQARRQNLQNMRSYKVILIGESAVGKSTLVARLCEDRFLVEGKQCTLGIDMFVKEMDVDGEKVKMYLWDTVGMETYDSITTQYYKEGDGIIIVYDITVLRSFTHLTKWMGYVETHANADNITLMLLGSKLDLEHKREVATDEGQKFADHYNIKHFFEVSAKSGDNVSEAFEEFSVEVHRKAQGTHPTPDPPPRTNSGKKCCF